MKLELQTRGVLEVCFAVRLAKCDLAIDEGVHSEGVTSTLTYFT